MSARLLCFAMLFISATSHAQTIPGVPTGSWMTDWADGGPSTGIAPALWWDEQGAGFSVGGTVAIGPRAARARLPVARPRRSPFSIELAAVAARDRRVWRGDALAVRFASLRLHAGGPSTGLWLGGGAVQSDDRDDGALPMLGAGVWIRRGAISLELRTLHLLNPVRSGSRLTTVVVRDTGGSIPSDRLIVTRSDDYRLFSGAEFALQWMLGRVELQSRAGALVGSRHVPATWQDLRVAYWGRPNVSIFAHVRSAQDVPEPLEGIRGTHSAVGVQVALGKRELATNDRTRRADPECELRRLDAGRYALRLRVRGQRVEIACDATDWNPLAAARVGPEVWECLLSLSPGLHRIVIRIDGSSWRPPKQLPVVPDEFGGRVGLLTAE